MTLIPLKSLRFDAAQQPEGLEVVVSREDIRDRYSSYLSDESKVRSEGCREMAFPRSIEEAAWILRSRAENGIPTTVSAARTGIAAGAVPPETTALLSVERMKTIGCFEPRKLSGEADEASIWVGAGVSLQELNSHLSAEHPEWIFPVDPTEWTAAIGGMTATNASGARTFHYGPMRDWVLGVRALLGSGEYLEISRGECHADDFGFERDFDGAVMNLSISEIFKPETKNTIGYTFFAGVDLLDVLIGSEGTLCVFCEVQLRLCKRPKSQLCYLQFFNNDDLGLEFVKLLRGGPRLPLALEYFDGRSLRLLKSNPAVKASPITQLINEAAGSAVYAEFALEHEDELFEISDSLGEFVLELKGDPERSFAGTEEKDLREFKLFRHALPEQINSSIALRKQSHPGLHKLATDMAVPDEFLTEIFHFYRDELDSLGFEFVIFGHAGNNHFHVNMLPRDEEELRIGKTVYLKFAEQVVRWRGAVAAEHGIGRLKRPFLAVQYSPDEITRMQEIKRFFDPRMLLNPGVLFS